MLEKNTHILSLGGSVVVPQKIDIAYLKKFRQLVADYVKKGHRFVIVVGGGGVNREYVYAAEKITKIKPVDLDWLGIAATKLNAELVRVVFGDLAYERVVNDPRCKVKTDKKVVIASGWEPGWSTDKDAVHLARAYGAEEVVNLFDKDYVYDDDPDQNKNAKPVKRIAWRDYRRLVGGKWSPRLSTPFDPIAAELAQKYALKVVVVKGSNLANLKKYLCGKVYKGTVIY